MQPKVTFLTRYYPPSPNINGESVCDMVEYLEKEYGIKSNIICTDRDFEGGGQLREPSGNVIRIKTLFKGRNAILRFLTFLYDGFSLVKRSLKYKNTTIIVTTSPPLLPFWASLLFSKRIKWGLWTLDLFPEGFYATGKIKSNNAFYKWVKKTTYKLKPDFLITLGNKQHEHLEKEYNSRIPASILPCGVFFYQDKSNEVPEWKNDDNLVYFGYCGNIGDAHNPSFLKNFIDQVDPSKHKLILALYGLHAPELKEYAKDRAGIVLVDSVPRNQLHFLDVHLVTLKSKWTHIAVPSKAVSAISMGGALIFCGSPESDNWYMFKENGWIIDENQDIPSQIEQILSSLNRESLKEKRSSTEQKYAYLQNCVLQTYKDVAKLTKGN
jgi:hypothetical protein